MIIEAGIIGQLVGLAGGVASSIVGYWQSKENNKHEQTMADINHRHESAMAKYKTQSEIDIHNVKAPDTEHDRTIEHDKALNGLRGLVRPLITISSYTVATIIAILLVTGTVDPTTWKQHMIEAASYLFGTSNMALGWYFGPRLTQKAMEMWRSR